MPSTMDYNALKAQTLGSGAEEEAVTVNTRALIDKVLARYSGEWTVLRELLQNAADANATKVTVKIETLPSTKVPLPLSPSHTEVLKHVVAHHTVKRLLITNNGQPFTEHDWSRLKRIAEGNPDETKIGAFGVGFYSVFADCEEPFISSGNQAMAFYWKGNSLFTRRMQLDANTSSRDTNFHLDYRNTTSPVPPLLQISQFLASSLTFVGIHELELYLDDFHILSLVKKSAPSCAIAISRDVETKTHESMMKVGNVTRQVSQIDGTWMNILGWKPPSSSAARAEAFRQTDPSPALRSFFSKWTSTPKAIQDNQPVAPTEDRGSDLLLRSSTVVFLNVTTATVETFVTKSFSQELERATKKPPPKTTKLAILTSPYIPAAEKIEDKSPSVDVFATVMPTKSGRVFIGFPTHQTTGLRAHVSAPSVIPTVERESIDLNARWVRTWNTEMLRATGILCRIAWSSEMTIIRENIQGSLKSSGKTKARSVDILPFVSDAISAARTFSFQESTPSESIGQIVEDAFWTCNKTASIELLSTCGVIPNHQIRVAPKSLSFMDGIPTLPEQLIKDAKTFVDRLIDFGLITEVTVTDIKNALERSALSSQQLREFLSWLGVQFTTQKHEISTVRDLLTAVVANDEADGGKSSQVLVLASVKSFLNPSTIPAGLPVPSSTIPLKFSKDLSPNIKQAFGWEELHIVPWIKWLVSEAGNRGIFTADQDLTQCPQFASKVLPVLSRQWDMLSQSSKETLVKLLSSQTIMPTKLGMRKPSDAYFPSVKVFDDLPVVTSLQSVKDKVLVALGVRKTLELGVIFRRLISDAQQSSGTDVQDKSQFRHIRLIQYLASVREDIPASDIRRLRDTPICPKEDRSESQASSDKRYKISSLYEPNADLRGLGLPILSWSGPYRKNSSEARLLTQLGLKTIPPVEELIELMTKAVKKNNPKAHDRAMGYFINNHHHNGYSSFDYASVTSAFLPIQDSTNFKSPSQCYTDLGASLFGFDVLSQPLHPHAAKFGVQVHPPIDDCVAALIQKPPQSKKDARILFSYFSGRLSEIKEKHIVRLGLAEFVPLTTNSTPDEKRPWRFVSPQNCFLGDSDEYGQVFDYVDFGQEANTFLMKCGSKYEPSKTEVARILVDDPQRIFKILGDPDKYLDLLRSLSDSLKTLNKNKALIKAMKEAPFLLASRSVVSSRKGQSREEDGPDEDEDEDDVMKIYELTSAAKAVIVDDFANYRLFKSEFLAAPQETGLEDFYYNLGAPLLSTLVQESTNYGTQLGDQKAAYKLQAQISERSKLFLHEQPKDSIRNDAKWIESHLTVVAVSSIKVTRSLRGRSLQHVQQRGAASNKVGQRLNLYISGHPVNYYEVSQCLVHLLLKRPTLHSPLSLEMLLKTDLRELAARGFNVSRILRQKAEQKRLTDRQKQLAEERRRIEDEETARKASQQKQLQDSPKAPVIPGGFPPDGPSTQSPTKSLTRPESDDPLKKVPKGLFQGMKASLGFNDTSFTESATSFIRDKLDLPPPYSQSQSQTPSKPHQVAPPQAIQQNLLSAIQKSRPHNSSTHSSSAETNNIAETKTYCDATPASNLVFAANARHGMRIYTDKTTVPDPTKFVTQNLEGLNAFASLLRDVAGVFPGLDMNSLQIFFNDNDKVIAFNSNGSIFCNYLYFRTLHQRDLMAKSERQHSALPIESSAWSKDSPSSGENRSLIPLTTPSAPTSTAVSRTGPGAGPGTSNGKAAGDAVLYWWITLCHELAHNLVKEHSAAHSYYIEHFVTEYLRRVVKVVGEYGG